MQKPEIVIIGGGISGLFFAYLCHKEKIPFLLIEAKDRLGGCIETIYRADSLPAELGPHMVDNSYPQTTLPFGMQIY